MNVFTVKAFSPSGPQDIAARAANPLPDTSPPLRQEINGNRIRISANFFSL
jgi:hypothetical protein